MLHGVKKDDQPRSVLVGLRPSSEWGRQNRWVEAGHTRGHQDYSRPATGFALEMAEILARISVEGRLCRDGFSTRAASVVTRALPGASGSDGLFGSVCAMSAAVRVLNNNRLNAALTVSRRDAIAIALWSALSFHRSLGEQRLENVRTELLESARRAGGELSRKAWARSTPRNSSYAAREREEIAILRWTLADESEVLARSYADVRSDEGLAVARGLDLGLLLTRFPVFAHFELASRGVAARHKIDLAELVGAVGEDRDALAAPFEASEVVEVCPAAFPLLTALRGEETRHADSDVARPLADWCGRALLESAIVRWSETYTEGR